VAAAALEIAVASLVVRLQLALVPISRVLGPDATLLPGALPPDAEGTVRRLERLVDACLSRRPIRARCLVRALVLRRVLRRRGLPCQLVITVRTDRGRLAAHASARLPVPGEPVRSLSLVLRR
jgi:hypothetical protein